jgi:steroid 5-alpha reductase family enzyme
MSCPLAAELLGASALVSYGMQTVNFMLSSHAICDNFTGLVEFLPVAVYGLARTSSPTIVQIAATCALATWSLRLGIFLLYRMCYRPAVDTRLGTPGTIKESPDGGPRGLVPLQQHEAASRHSAASASTSTTATAAAALFPQRSTYNLAIFWFCHGSWGFFVSLPVTLLNACEPSPDLRASDTIGVTLWVVGFIVEAWADHVKLCTYMNGDRNRYYDMNGHILWRST